MTDRVLYESISTAPIVYFDQVPAHGTIGGAIEAELAIRGLNLNFEGNVDVRFITSGRLRCSPAAASLSRLSARRWSCLRDNCRGRQRLQS